MSPAPKRFDCLPLPRSADGRACRISDKFNLPGFPGYDPDHRQHRGADSTFRKNVPESPIDHPHSSKHYEIPEGTLAVAVLPGVVVYAEMNFEAWIPGDHRTGYVVVIDHGGGLRTARHHLAELRVKKGDVVTAGQVIGVTGGSPNAAGKKPGTPGLIHDHLDAILVKATHVDGPTFNARHAGQYIDPGPFFRGAVAVPHIGVAGAEAYFAPPPPDPTAVAKALAAAGGAFRRIGDFFR